MHSHLLSTTPSLRFFIFLGFLCFNQQALAQLPDDQTCRNNELGVKCRECNQSNQSWSTQCDLRVSIKCTYRDETNIERSCFPDDSVFNDKPDPTFSLTDTQCQLRPEAFEYEATIVYEMCNANPKSFTPRPYLLDANYVRYVDEEALDPSTNLDPDRWDNTVPAATGGVPSCRTHVETRIFKPCVHDIRGMSISMDGVLAKSFPNYCRCFLREWVRSEVSDPEPLETPAPTSSPTMSPSARPTSRPTKAPTKAPTKSPSASPSYVPSGMNNNLPIPAPKNPNPTPTSPISAPSSSKGYPSKGKGKSMRIRRA